MAFYAHKLRKTLLVRLVFNQKHLWPQACHPLKIII